MSTCKAVDLDLDPIMPINPPRHWITETLTRFRVEASQLWLISCTSRFCRIFGHSDVWTLFPDEVNLLFFWVWERRIYIHLLMLPSWLLLVKVSQPEASFCQLHWLQASSLCYGSRGGCHLSGVSSVQDWSPHMSFISKGSQISAFSWRVAFKSKTSIQEYRDEIQNSC